ncbi:MAG: hypothetical protein WBC22_19550 [Sedimentisphaerales bacterium]
MSIAKRIIEAYDKMNIGDAEAALIPASIAVDATAQKEYPDLNTGEAYKQFLHKNLELITRVAFGGNKAITNSFRINYKHPKIKADKDGLCSIEQVWYHVVRCGLLHGGCLPSSLKFIWKTMIKVDDDLLVLPATLVYGLMFAVIASPVNINETAPHNWGITCGENRALLNDLWGKKDRLLKLFDPEKKT